jgi:hypothetical protein
MKTTAEEVLNIVKYEKKAHKAKLDELLDNKINMDSEKFHKEYNKTHIIYEYLDSLCEILKKTIKMGRKDEKI